MPAKRPATPEEHRAIMDALLARFAWPVEEEYMHEAFEVITDHARRKHTVLWPRDTLNREPAFGRYLHEMAHALLAEQVHPQFSRPYFARGLDPALKNTYSPLLDTSLDWFVQALLMEVAPGPQGDDIDARYRQAASVLRQGGALPSVEFVIDSGMALASFSHYRGLEVDTQGKLSEVVQAFLRTPPDKPTLFGLHGLVRRLVGVFGMHTAHLVHEHGFERWRLDPVKRD